MHKTLDGLVVGLRVDHTRSEIDGLARGRGLRVEDECEGESEGEGEGEADCQIDGLG